MPPFEKTSNNLKNFLKEQLDVNNDTQLKTHIEPITQKYASDVCEKKGRHWSRARVVNSIEGLDTDFKLKKDNLHDLVMNKISNGKEFCITEDYKENILADVCK